MCRYIRPQFFYNNPLLSFVQYVIGPYTDELGNVLPQAVPGLGVPIDPLAFAGLLGTLQRIRTALTSAIVLYSFEITKTFVSCMILTATLALDSPQQEL